MLQWIFAFLPLSLVLSGANAQELKLAGAEFAAYTKSDLLQYTGTSVDYYEVGGFVTIPIVSEDSADILVNQVRYRQLNTGLNHSELYALDRVQQNYYQITWALNWIHSFNREWLLVTSVTPTLASDLERKLSWDDLLMQAALLLRRKAGTNWKYGVGLSYNTGFGRPLLMPIAELSYRKLPWTVSALVPVSVQAMYHSPNDAWRAGLLVSLEGSYFHLGIGDLLPGSPAALRHAEYTRVNMGPVLDIRLRGPVRLELTGGVATQRALRFVNEDATLADLKAAAGPFFKATLAYVIKLPGAE